MGEITACVIIACILVSLPWLALTASQADDLRAAKFEAENLASANAEYRNVISVRNLEITGLRNELYDLRCIKHAKTPRGHGPTEW